MSIYLRVEELLEHLEKLGITSYSKIQLNGMLQTWKKKGKVKVKKDGSRNIYLLFDVMTQLGLKQKRELIQWFNSNKHKELSKNMWLPSRARTERVKLDSSDKALDRAWFKTSKITANINIPEHKDCFCLPIVNNTEKLRTTKYRLDLSKEIQQIYFRCFDVVRWSYNRCVEFWRLNPVEKSEEINPLYLVGLRNASINLDELNISDDLRKELDSIPYTIRETAVNDFSEAVKIQLDLLNDGKIKEFEMKFRSKKEYQSFSIPSRNIKGSPKELTFFPRKFKDYKHLGPLMKCNEGIHNIKHTVRIVWNGIRGRGGVFTANVPYDIPRSWRSSCHPNACSIDPGERIFISVYGSDGNSYTIGDKASRTMDRLAVTAEKLRQGVKRVVKLDELGNPMRNSNGRLIKEFDPVSRENSSNPCRTRRNMKKRAQILEYKIDKFRTELHRKTVKFLTDKYDKIIIPKFNTRKLCEKKDENGNYIRDINPDVTRRLTRLAHYKFRSLLIAKGEDRVFVGTEEYTSKTCGNCFKLNEDLGSKRTFRCPNCGIVGHRDILAARNIMILNSEQAGLQPERLFKSDYRDRSNETLI